MSWYNHSEAADQKEQLALEIERRRKRGETFEPFVAPITKKLTTQFWGHAWCRHLETYCGYETRLPKGRSYLRAGHVYNLTVAPGLITAEVAGSYLYEVSIRIQPLDPDTWSDLKKICQGQVGSLLDLLSGKLGDHVMKTVVDPDQGLFPDRTQIRHQCSCPDAADLCKHQAAVLYAVGILFDRDPKFFFELRGVDPSELIATSAAALTDSLNTLSSSLADEDLSALFGIDLAEPTKEGD